MKQSLRQDLEKGTRSDLIAAARGLFSRRGFDGTSVRAITAEAGANLGAVTYHFGSKRALYDAVLDDGLRPIVARVRTATTSEGTALDRIVRVVEAYFGHLGEHPDLPRLLLQELAAGKEPPAVVREIVSGLKRALVRLHEEGVREGSIRPGDPFLTALSVVAQPVYLTLVSPLARSIGGLDLDDPPTRARTLDHITDFVRSALEPEGSTS